MRPKSLSLREAIMVTLLYKRQNMIEEVIADLFGVSQYAVRVRYIGRSRADH